MTTPPHYPYRTWDECRDRNNLSHARDRTQYQRVYWRGRRGLRTHGKLFCPPRPAPDLLCGKTWKFWAEAIKAQYGFCLTPCQVRDRVQGYRRRLGRVTDMELLKRLESNCKAEAHAKP